MNKVRKVMEIIILSFGFTAFLLTGLCFADSMTMQFSPDTKFTYRLTADNKIILPGPIQVRFSRSDPGTFCGKVVEVGVYASSVAVVTNNAAPGTSDPYRVLYTSPISGGAALCNFNYNDNLVTLKTDEGTNRSFSDWLKESANPLADNYYKSRRVQRTLLLSFTPDYNFKVFIKGTSGNYEWRNPVISSAIVKDKGGLYGIPYELVIDPIPNTPPRIDKITMPPSPLPAIGGPIKISVISADDLGVKNVSVFASAGGSSLSNFALTNDGTTLGKAPDGRLISLWEGTYNVDSNLSTSRRSLSFRFMVSDDEGLTNNSLGYIRQIEQLGTPDTQAPKIDSVTIAPQSFPSTGGAIAVSARASDNIGVVSVRLDLTLPDGQLRPMEMAMASGSSLNAEWKSSWNMWANTSNNQAVYGIKVTAKDASNNTVSSQSFPITVDRAPIKTIQQQPSGQLSPINPKAPVGPPIPVPIR
jgi:hypothetical protein